MWKYLFPRIAWSDFPPLLAAAVIGGLIAGCYGIAHDQFTYSISPEYFTKLKFKQFHYADFGWGNRAFAATIGFLASWWVGAIIAWFLARRLIPQQPRARAFRQIYASYPGCCKTGCWTSEFGRFAAPGVKMSRFMSQLVVDM
jgi:hypothetical protein